MADIVTKELPGQLNGQLNGHSPRRLYTGRNLARAISIEDLRARTCRRAQTR